MKKFYSDIFCERAKQLFGDIGQVELAKKLEISQTYISAIINKKIKSPGADILYKIAKYYNVSADYLLGLSNAPTCDTELKVVCQYIGCSQETVEFLKNNPDIDIELLKKYYEIRKPLNEIINNLI